MIPYDVFVQSRPLIWNHANSSSGLGSSSSSFFSVCSQFFKWVPPFTSHCLILPEISLCRFIDYVLCWIQNVSRFNYNLLNCRTDPWKPVAWARHPWPMIKYLEKLLLGFDHCDKRKVWTRKNFRPCTNFGHSSQNDIVFVLSAERSCVYCT